MTTTAAATTTNFREVYDLDGERGFLPATDPLQSAPPGSPACFATLERLCSLTCKLLLTGTFRERIHELEEGAFDEIICLAARDKKQESPLLRLAMSQLSFLSHTYMWGAKEPSETLPAILSRPWAACARALGRPPILSYASYCLDNWHRLDADKPIGLDNVALIHNFLGGVDEHWFVTVHVAIEHAAAPGLVAAHALVLESEKEAPCEEALHKHLTALGDSLAQMDALFARMPERCDPYVYYHRVRPFIFGTKNNPDLPSGMIYEGEFQNEPQLFRGETGAQSSILPAFDGALGVQHEKDELRHYLNEMREYMPVRHREFISFIEEHTHVRELVQKMPGLVAPYDRCLEGLRNFRSRHLEYAATYIQRQSKSASLVGSGGSTEWGTGGTPFLPYLKKHRDETAAQTLRGHGCCG